jgi:hypothetical protein
MVRILIRLASELSQGLIYPCVLCPEYTIDGWMS